jgi:hypothetical protein
VGGIRESLVFGIQPGAGWALPMNRRFPSVFRVPEIVDTAEENILAAASHVKGHPPHLAAGILEGHRGNLAIDTKTAV